MKRNLDFVGLSFFILFLGNGLLHAEPSIEEEAKMNVSEIIKSYGYPLEMHSVTTEDGYILSLQRIPYGLKNTSTDSRPVVLLQHGLLDSSFTYVSNGPEKSLGFILADNGFDVWLSNSRGNIYSNSHIKYSKNEQEFWDFTWDEMAKYDLPSVINYALSVSQASKLGYVGHSQGGEIGFAKFSDNSGINSKVFGFVALAPAVFLGHMKSALKYILLVSGGVNLVLNLIGNGEFIINDALLREMAQFVCKDKIVSQLCENVIFLLEGVDEKNFNLTRLPIYLAHLPAGTSSKNIHHYGQSYISNEFQMYDHGLLKNLAVYNQATPPKYNLDTNGLPVAILYGGNDDLTDPVDINRVADILKDNVKFKKLIPDYNHLDLVWANDAYTRIFPDVVNFLYQYAGT